MVLGGWPPQSACHAVVPTCIGVYCTVPRECSGPPLCHHTITQSSCRASEVQELVGSGPPEPVE
eukprot:5073342-Pyramimonas_sp.AAC.1